MLSQSNVPISIITSRQKELLPLLGRCHFVYPVSVIPLEMYDGKRWVTSRGSQLKEERKGGLRERVFVEIESRSATCLFALMVVFFSCMHPFFLVCSSTAETHTHSMGRVEWAHPLYVLWWINWDKGDYVTLRQWVYVVCR